MVKTTVKIRNKSSVTGVAAAAASLIIVGKHTQSMTKCWVRSQLASFGSVV